MGTPYSYSHEELFGFEDEECPRFEIRYSYSEASMEFTVYEVQSYDEETGKAVIRDFDGDPVLHVEGFIKWDACSNMSFSEPNLNLHFCGMKGVQAHNGLMLRLYQLAAVKFPEIDERATSDE